MADGIIATQYERMLRQCRWVQAGTESEPPPWDSLDWTCKVKQVCI